MFAVKFRGRGKRAWYFATSRGTSTRLRIHAARFGTEERAKEVAAEYACLNPGLEIKVVRL